MININILKCLYVQSVHDYMVKLRSGVQCDLAKYDENMNLAYNYLKIGTAYKNKECTITPKFHNDIIHFQMSNSFTLETCC